VRVRYIGRAPHWKDKSSLHGSGIDFESGQVRAVPERLAKSLLRHGDLFEQAHGVFPAATDDTVDVLTAAKEARDKQARLTRERLDVLAQIERLDKAGLVKYAADRFGEKLAMTDSRDTLRDRVRDMIDMFGGM
jgi:hypothetical protein